MLKQNGRAMPAKLLKMHFMSIIILKKETWKPEITTYLEKKGTVKKSRDKRQTKYH